MSKRPLDPDFERDVALVRQAVSRGEARRHAEIEARKAELAQRVPELAAILFGAGARRVWHFGSLVWGRAHEASDIDLAVEGLPAASFFEVYDRLCRAAGEPVDLVTLEGIEPAFAERIRAHGRELMRENEYEQVHRG